MTALAPDNAKGSRVSSSVVDHLRELVSSGQLGPGDRLPAERDLAERLGVGRNSIREALRELQMLGLVEARRGAGTFVRAADPSSLMAPFQTVISLSDAAVDDVMEFRRAFEPEVAALAARHATDGDIADLQSALRRFDQAVASDDRPYGADVDFHEVVARCTGNPLIMAVQHALAQLFAEMRSRLSDSSYQPDNRAARGHQALFGAIVAGDPDAARDVMRQHLDEVEESLGRWREASGSPA
jgi:GntR family transcriptional regulator, transcriptional repressor for pyruvate dehydrogenase complex